VLRLINFAHSEVFMLGSFGGLFAARQLVPGGADGPTPAGLTAIALVVAGLAAGAAAGGASAFAVERAAYRPLRRRGAPPLAYLISAIGASLFAYNLAGKEFGRQSVPVPELFTDGPVLSVGSVAVSTQSALIIGVAAVMLLGVDRLVSSTRFGQAVRAVAQDAQTASLMGVDVEKIITGTFVLGGLLAGAGGFLYAMTFNASYTMGFVPGIKAFTAAVLGGIGNVRGAVLGGLLLGLLESYGGYLLDASYRDVIAFGVLVVILLARPAGILGARAVRAA